MAPRQVPQQLPWRDAHPFLLLSPLMALLSRAWSRLRGPGSPKPWLVETVQSADQGEAEAALATCYAPWGGHPPRVAEGSGAAVEDGESSWMACPALEANSSLLEAWELSDDNDEGYGEEEATSGPTEQGSEYKDGQSAPPSPSLLETLPDPPGEEESEEGGVAEDKAIASPFPPSHWDSGPGMEKEDRKAVSEEAPSTSTSPLSPGPKPRAWVYCAGEAQAPAKEEERTENKKARKTSTSSSWTGSRPSAWECYSGEESEEEGEAEGPSSIPPPSTFLRAWVYRPGEDPEDEEEEEDSDSGAAEDEGEAEGPSSIPPTSTFLRAWVYRPGEDTEDEEEEEEDSDSGAAEDEGEAGVSSSIPPTSTFLRAWVYRPGEDTEDDEEEEDSDSGAAEDEGEAEGPSSSPPTSTFLRAWVYRPGEDTEDEEEEEDNDSGAAEEKGEAVVSSSISPTSAFSRSWVYRPGEDSEEEDEENEKDGSEAAGSEPGSSIQAQGSFFRGWRSAPGKETEGGEAEPHPFQVAIYLPGEKPPPPWALPRLPARLQRRLKSAETPTQHLDPETPQKTTKVRFSEKVSIQFLVVWAGPAQAARQGPWEQLARDRSRFARRIAQAEEVLGPCFTPVARAKAWARLRNTSPPLAATPATTHTLPTSSVQAMTLSHTVISPFPIYVAVPPCLTLSWRCG